MLLLMALANEDYGKYVPKSSFTKYIHNTDCDNKEQNTKAMIIII